MEFLNDRIGVLLKYGKVLGSLAKRFFYIDNTGNLYYTNDESISKKFLDTKSFNDEYLIGLIAPISKKINLSECSVSAIKQFLEDKFNLKCRSYFELFLKTRDYRTILVFSWAEEHINFLRDYFLSISNFNEMNSLNDQFGKYDFTDNNNITNALDKDFGKDNQNYFDDASRNNINNNRINNNNSLDNSEFNMAKNKEKSTQKIFEFAEVSGNQDKNNSNNSALKELSGNSKSDKENLINIKNNNNNNNKDFSFKNQVIDSEHKELKNFSEKEKLDASEANFINKQKNTINKLNQDFKTGIDNLNTKLNSDLNHKEEDVKYMEDYNSYNSVNNNNKIYNITNTNYTEAIKNKIYQFNYEEKKRVEELLDKLNGRFVNQIDWDKACIRLVNPSGSEYEYEETWAQMENGSEYSGHVVNFMPNGQGKEYRKDGIFYSGELRNGKWHGIGVITDVNLDTFQGEFVNGCICGI